MKRKSKPKSKLKTCSRRAFINPEATMFGVVLLFLSTLLFATATYVGWRWAGYLGMALLAVGILLCLYDWLFMAQMKKLRRERQAQKTDDKID